MKKNVFYSKLIIPINMVKGSKLFFVIIFIANFSIIFAQKCTDFPDLDKFHNFSISFGGKVYRKAEMKKSYGNYSTQVRSNLTYSFGMNYEFFTSNKWSTNIGLFFASVPYDHTTITILQKDVYSGFGRDLVHISNENSILHCSIPLTIQYKFKLFNRNYFGLHLGGLMQIIPKTEYEYIISALIYENTSADVYGLIFKSSESYFHGGFISGFSYYIDLKKILLEFKFSYTTMFQNIFEGEYQFANLLTAAPTRGIYKVSGDNIEFSISTHFLKKKK